jgi:hypothetical protein
MEQFGLTRCSSSARDFSASTPCRAPSQHEVTAEHVGTLGAAQFVVGFLIPAMVLNLPGLHRGHLPNSR